VEPGDHAVLLENLLFNPKHPFDKAYAQGRRALNDGLARVGEQDKECDQKLLCDS